MSGRIIPTFLGKGQRFPEIEPRPTFWSLLIGLGTALAPLGMSLSLLTCYSECAEDEGLVQVDLSAILDPFDSNQLMMCPRAVSFLQRLCPASFSRVSLPCSLGRLSP